MKYTENTTIAIALKVKLLTVSDLDSWISLFCQAGKEIETGGEPRVICRWAQPQTDAEWRLDALSLFTGHGSSLVSGTTWSSQSHPGTQCLRILTSFHSCYISRTLSFCKTETPHPLNTNSAFLPQPLAITVLHSVSRNVTHIRRIIEQLSSGAGLFYLA